MKLSRPLKIQVLGFLYSMPFICLGYIWIFYAGRAFTDWRPWLYSVPVIYLVGIPSWYLHIQYDHYIRRRFPSLKETGKRVSYKILTNPLIMTPSAFLIVLIHNWFHILGYQIRPGDFKYVYVIGLVVNLIFDTLWEVLYTLEKFKESLAEKGLLEQMAIEHEFERLKSQVNPHFLFNCFNTLSSLIAEDKKEAGKFLDELSKVYRYLLKNNEDGMTTVEKEVNFIHSYFQLLKTRYGDALQIRMDIDRQYYPYYLPSLSLQLLVENAVKHNVVSKQQPLILEIFSLKEDRLVVNNNLQPKPVNKGSTGIGLNNISAKYKLMKQEGFEVLESDNQFTVVLPLTGNGTDMYLIQ